MNYLKKIVEEFHSAVVATIDHKVYHKQEQSI